MTKFQLNSIDELTEQVIHKIIKRHQMEIPRMELLEEYYANKNAILRRQMADETKPNNKVANPYASYISDTLVGYFMGEPVRYTCDDDALLEDLQMIFEYNDEADENSELAKDASIVGIAFEELYVDEADKMIRFKRLDPKSVIPIYDKTIQENMIACIRYYKDFDYTNDTTYTIIEVLDDTMVRTYRSGDVISSLELLDEHPHYFGMVPIAVYENNEDLTGDFEKVISLIDAYDKMESDSMNDFEYFVDAYLALYGFTADSEDIVKMKQNRVLLMDEGTKAEWLIKNENDSLTENMKNRLDKDIHKFAKCPNMSDEEFAGNASGIAIKFKMLGTENLVSIKERKFKKGLQQRLELISMITGVLSTGFDWRSIDITFTRNIPTNDLETAQMVNLYKDLVSDDTLLAQIPFVEDIAAEVERVKEQKEENKLNNPFFQNQDYKMKDEDQEEEENG